MMRSMGRATRLALAVLILAATVSAGLRAAADGDWARAGHCASVASPGHLHPQHDLLSSQPGPDSDAHRCPGCASGRCPTSAHCVSAGALALAPAAPVLLTSASAAEGYRRAADQARSVHSSPPIPPPQPVL
jgi:hypothetical protein